jgi:hypothetical protein
MRSMFRTRPGLEGMPQGLENKSHFSAEEVQRLFIRFKELRDEATGLVPAEAFCEMHELALCPIAAAFIVTTMHTEPQTEQSNEDGGTAAAEPAASPTPPVQSDSENFLKTGLNQAGQDGAPGDDASAAKSMPNQPVLLETSREGEGGETSFAKASPGVLRGLDFEAFVAALSPLSPLASTNEKLRYVLQAIGVSDDSTSLTRNQYRNFVMATVGSNLSSSAVEKMMDGVFASDASRRQELPSLDSISLADFAMKLKALDYAAGLTVNF